MGLRNALFISALNGDGLHSVWETLNGYISEDMGKEYKDKLKKRRKRVKAFRREYETVTKEFLKEFKDKPQQEGAEEENADSKGSGLEAEFKKFMKNDPHVQRMNRKGKFIDQEYFLEKFDEINKDKVRPD